MSVGVDFVLKASTAGFTRALATVSNETEKLRKGLMNKFEGRDLARGLTTALGLSVEKIGEKFARMWTGMSEKAEEAYKELGDLTDTLTEKTIEAGKARLNDEQRYQLALMETEKLQKSIAENVGKTIEEQVKLTKDKIALLAKEKEAEEARQKVSKENEEHAQMFVDAQRKYNEGTAKLEKDERRDNEDKYQKAEDALRDKFAPSVEQLANMSAGGFAEKDDPRLIAKQILEKEKFAAEAGNRGDIEGAIKLGREARNMRESLQNVAGSGTALNAETAESAMRKALEDTNKELGEVKKAMEGIIKAGK